MDGEKCKPRVRNLNNGEQGLWETWISLLEEKLANDYEFLHIMEDDCIVSSEFKKDSANSYPTIISGMT